MKIYKNRPENFNPHTYVSGCYIEDGGKLLLLQRTLTAKFPAMWTVPSGKIQQGETFEQCAFRELFEETGIGSEYYSDSKFLGLFYISGILTGDYIYCMFKIKLLKMPSIRLSHEHIDYKWATLEEIKNMNLLGGYEMYNYYQELNIVESLRQ